HFDHPRSFDHRFEEGLCSVLNLVHPASVASDTNTFRLESEQFVCLEGLTDACLPANRDPTDDWHFFGDAPGVTSQYLEHPLRQDMLGGYRRFTAKYADPRGHWYARADGRQKADAANVEGFGDSRPDTGRVL